MWCSVQSASRVVEEVSDLDNKFGGLNGSEVNGVVRSFVGGCCGYLLGKVVECCIVGPNVTTEAS